MADDADFTLPAPRTARDLDFHQHEYISPACNHLQHDACDDGCRFCGSPCRCSCHHWLIAKRSHV